MENSNFSMTLTKCRQVLDTFDNLVVIDDRGYIRYLSPDMYFMIEAYNKKPVPDDVIGRHISDVHYVSKVTNALETGRPMKTAFYFSSNVTNIARIEPVYRDGKLVGAIDYDLFTDGNKLRKFVDMAGNMWKAGMTVLNHYILILMIPGRGWSTTISTCQPKTAEAYLTPL